MIKILVADDHPIVRHGLKQILSDAGDMSVEGEASSSSETLQRLWKDDYDVVLLDVSMPGRSGLEIIKEIKADNKKTSVLMLSAYPEEQYAVRAIKSGASGYLVKKSAPEELVNAVRKVSRGGKYISTSLAEQLAFALEEDQEKKPHEKLSVREFEVMTMISSGKTVKEIGEELALSVKTISTHRTRILEKMGLKNNAEIIYYAVKAGLVE